MLPLMSQPSWWKPTCSCLFCVANEAWPSVLLVDATALPAEADALRCFLRQSLGSSNALLQRPREAFLALSSSST